MNPKTLELPTGVRAAVLKLLNAVEVAESVRSVNMAAQRAEGFVLGLETAGAFRPDVLEALYIGFESASQLRLAHLRESLTSTN